MLNETKVYSKSAIKIKGFQSFPVVRNKNKGGGAFIGVRHGLCEPIMIDCAYRKNNFGYRCHAYSHCIFFFPKLLNVEY